LATKAASALAIEGRAADAEAAFAPWPSFEADEIAAAAEVLEVGEINYRTGEQGRWFEEEFASFAGCKHAVARWRMEPWRWSWRCMRWELAAAMK
jgi:hypothetical protein